MKLNEIRDNKGAHKRSRRLGRGIGSGRGKTCGRGGKGQTARTGVRIKGFEGGQMPLHRRLPKRGFNNPNRVDFVAVNLADIQQYIDSGKLKFSDKIDAVALKNAGVIKNARAGVRLLATGVLKQAVTLEVYGASQKAKALVEKAGGKVTVLQPTREAPSNSFAARREKARDTAKKAFEARSAQKTEAASKAKKEKGAAA